MFCQPFFLFFRSCFTYHTDNYKMCSLETEAGINAIELGKGLLNYEALFHLFREREPVINILLEGAQVPFITECTEYLKRKYDYALVTF